MRIAIYTTARFGIFMCLADVLKKRKAGENLSLAQKGMCSIFAGGLSSFVATPADLILIRMQSDSSLPKDQRRYYTSLINAV